MFPEVKFNLHPTKTNHNQLLLHLNFVLKVLIKF